MFAAITSAHHTIQTVVAVAGGISSSIGIRGRPGDEATRGSNIFWGDQAEDPNWLLLQAEQVGMVGMGWMGWMGWRVYCRVFVWGRWIKTWFFDAGMMAKDEDDEVVDIWMEWFSWKV